MSINIVIEPKYRDVAMAAIPNATIFTGTINGYVSAGPFIKIGSISTGEWIVAKLESMEGGVWTSGRDKDARVQRFKAIDVREIVLRESSAGAK